MTSPKASAFVFTRVRRWAGQAWSRGIFSDVDGRVFRRYRLGARHRLAMRGFAKFEEFFGMRADGDHSGSFDDFANAAIDRSGDTRAHLHVDAASFSETWIDQW